MLNFFTLIVLFLSAGLFFLFKRRSNRRSLPGPKGYPVIGNMFEMAMDTNHVQFYELSKKFGDIFEISVLGKRIVVLNSAEVIRDFFAKEPNATVTAKRPDTFLGKYIWNYSDVIFSPMGKTLTQRRKYLHRALHIYGEEIRTLAAQITGMLSNLSTEITQLKGRTANPVSLIDDFILGTLQTLLIGKISEDKDLPNLIREFNLSFNSVATIGNEILFGFVPFLRYTSLPGTKAIRTVLEKKSDLLKKIDEVAKNDPNHQGVYHYMLKTIQDGDTEWFTKENLMGFLEVDVIFAGYITTRNMLVTLVRVLLSAPETQKQLQDEVDAVIGRDRKPVLEDRYTMPFTEAVTLETFRYISHVPETPLHEASENIEYKGYLITKGTQIVANLWASHHLEKDWNRPFEFDPSRFLDEDGKVFPADHQVRKNLVTFGIGKRSCIGEVFARTRIFLFLTSLMQMCTVTPENGKVPPMLSPYDMCPGAVLQPPEYRCKFVKRD